MYPAVIPELQRAPSATKEEAGDEVVYSVPDLLTLNGNCNASSDWWTGDTNNPCLKDVRAHCYCASLLRRQIHTPRHALSARDKKK